MIFDTKPTSLVESSGDLETTKFSIEESAKAFMVLSSTLYKDKIRSIIRELSSNARDAHVDAETTDKQFDVHLPTGLEPEFWIRDYGTGLSDENIKNVYIRLFKSTKETSNAATGCLGLGSKSPFAYTQSFMVTSWFGGKKIIYSIFTDENSHPQIAKMLEMESDEPNGLEVRFNVPVSDKQKFIDAARKVYMWFDFDKPNFVGHSLDVKEGIEQATIGDVTLTTYRYGRVSSCSVVMGNVEYPVDLTNSLVQEIKVIKEVTELVGDSYNTNVSIRVPMGTVEFSPSREDLQYTKKTIDALKNHFAGASISIKKMVPEFDEKSLIGKNFREQFFLVEAFAETVQTFQTTVGLVKLCQNVVKKVRDLPFKSYLLGKIPELAHVSIGGRSVVSTYNSSNWFNATHIIIQDITGDLSDIFAKTNPTAISHSLWEFSGSVKKCFDPTKLDIIIKALNEHGYATVLASDLLSVKLKDRKYSTAYLMNNQRQSFKAMNATAAENLKTSDIQVYWVPMRNKAIQTNTRDTGSMIELAHYCEMPFVIVGVYLPTQVDTSSFKSFDESFEKDLDLWMSSAPSRNPMMHIRLNEYDSSDLYLYQPQADLFQQIIGSFGFNDDQITLPSRSDLYLNGKKRTTLSGIDRHFSVSKLKEWRFTHILDASYGRFPLTRFKDANQFQPDPATTVLRHFKKTFASFCEAYSIIEDTTEQHRVIIKAGKAFLKNFPSFASKINP